MIGTVPGTMFMTHDTRKQSSFIEGTFDLYCTSTSLEYRSM